MKKSTSQPCLAAILCLSLAGSITSAREVVVSSGHYDLAVDYVPGEGWRSYIRDFDAAVELGTWDTIFHVNSTAETTVPSSSGYQFLGTPGERVWILPEVMRDADIPHMVWLGLGSPLLQPGIFAGGYSNRGRLNLRLVEVVGTGPENGGVLTLYGSGFPPVVYFSSAGGPGDGNGLEFVGQGHAHYNWAFSAPGIYRATFEWSGNLAAAHGGGFTSTEVTYNFEVLHAGDDTPLRYAWEWSDGWKWSSWMEHVFTEEAPWIYELRLGWLYLPAGDPAAFWFWIDGHGWAFSSQSYFPWYWSDPLNDWVSP